MPRGGSEGGTSLRKIYNKFYRISDDEKISDRVMTCRLISMVLFVLFCVAAMSFAAYSYFECDVSSKDNHVEAATFRIHTAVTYTSDDNPSSTQTTVPEEAEGSFILQADNNKTYTIKISKTADSTAETGFCVVKVEGDNTAYHTVQLENNGTLSFIIKNKSASTPVKVTFSPHWGTSSYYSEYQSGTQNNHYIESGNQIIID